MTNVARLHFTIMVSSILVILQFVGDWFEPLSRLGTIFEDPIVTYPVITDNGQVQTNIITPQNESNHPIIPGMMKHQENLSMYNAETSVTNDFANATTELNQADSFTLICQDLHNWTNHDRLTNSHIDHRTATLMIESNPISYIDELLGQTVCHPDGKFRSTSTSKWNVSNDELVKEWELKLIYLVVHDLHHRPARSEHQERKTCPQSFPAYDYRCESAKYVVTSLEDIGMGASVRLGAVAHILVGIATDRIPLIVAKTPAGPRYLQSPWKLASCAREDMQCMFLPTSPCTLLASDLANATVLDQAATRGMKRSGVEPKHAANDRVIITETKSTPAKFDVFEGIHNNVRRRMHVRAMELIDEWSKTATSAVDATKLDVLVAAANRIGHRDLPDEHEHYTYGHRYYRIAHAVLLYLLRPSFSAASLIQQRLETIIPAQLDHRNTIGMPIRGSDKCHSESTCLGFDKYMKLARETWELSPLHEKTRGALVVTTEDSSIFQQRLHYNNSNFPLDIIVNEEDSMQGTGKASTYGESADDIILSSMVAIKMHLHAGHVYGNCCSNFHLMLFDFLREGCGLTTQTTCMQEAPGYNMCCAWTKSEECTKIREQISSETVTQR